MTAVVEVIRFEKSNVLFLPLPLLFPQRHDFLSKAIPRVIGAVGDCNSGAVCVSNPSMPSWPVVPRLFQKHSLVLCFVIAVIIIVIVRSTGTLSPPPKRVSLHFHSQQVLMICAVGDVDCCHVARISCDCCFLANGLGKRSSSLGVDAK